MYKTTNDTIENLDNPKGFILSPEERQDIIDEMLTYLNDTDGNLSKTTSDVKTIEENGADKAKKLINNSLETQIDGNSKEILKDFNFGSVDYAGAVKAGDVTWNQSTGAITGGSGVIVYRKGIVGVSGGNSTFSLDATTGDAMFAGELSAATGTFAGTVSAGAIIAANINADLINAGTLTGRTVKANNGTGADVWIQNIGNVSFRYGGVEKGNMYVDNNGNMLINATDDMFVVGNDNTQVGSYGNMLLWGDDITIGYDDDNDGSDLYFVSQGATQNTAKLTTGGDFKIHGSYYTGYGDYAEFFENKNKEEIKPGIAVVIDNGKIREAKEKELPFGVISANPSIIGNDGSTDAGESWHGKYLKDKIGRFIYREEMRYKYYINKKRKITKNKNEIPSGAKVEKYKTLARIINPKYDETKKYIPRAERKKEWSIVALLGQVYIKKGQQINPNWIKIKEINNEYDLFLIK